MSQNKKRPVTYGKSSFTRARVGLYVPDSDTSSKPPSFRTSSSDGLSATPTNHPLSSVSSFGSPLARTFSGSSLTQAEDAHTAMQGKRRKLLREEAHQHNPYGQTKAGFVGPGNPGDYATPKEEVTSTAFPGRDENQKGSDPIRSLRSDVLPKPKSPERALTSSSRSARRLKSTPPTSDGKSMVSSADAQPRTDTSSPRKRLIDSLGMTNQPPSPMTLEPNDDPASILHARLPHQKFPASTPAGDDTKLRPRNVERSQTTPTRSLSSMLRSSRVTYSRQRSFLNDLIGATDSEPPGVSNGARLNSDREAHGLLASHVPPEDEDSNGNKAVRSIHELRQTGDNARFREIVDSIFEDIEDQYNSLSGRCCSIADLCHKLHNAVFAHRFSEQGFDERLVNCIAISPNIIWLSLAFSAFRLIVVGGRASRVFAESLWASILDHSPILLDNEDDLLILAREPSQGLSKTAQAAVRGLRPHLLPATMSRSAPMSPRLLALECIKSALKLLRENGHSVRHAPITFLDTLLSELIFSVLENYSIVTGPFDDDHCQCLRRLSQLRGPFILAPRHLMRPTMMSYVRVILNLTNKEPALCESFALPELVSGLVEIVITECSDVSKDPAPNENDALNAVILALGTLINLAEKTEKARVMLVQSKNLAVSPLQQLLKQFSGSASSLDHAHSVSEVHENVVAGYLSILFLTLCLNTEARLLVKKSLDGKGLVLAFSTAEKFLQYHREVEKENGLAETYEGEFGLTKRLEHILSQARRLEGNSDELP
ncbi:wings apart-like protein regulation of heterochromatin-domain-containing protein [Aspergillus keveii]|uniref:Wings apart-like protein regulation of heterochromatin-domain-containing protein n=1 Tax=Aspergillus keveii TaxID=714993 RepID=A0ABR4FWF2_9EURO